MSDNKVRQQLNFEIERISLNQLNELGNQAVALGLIGGHGHHRGQYEILRQGEVLLMSPQAAIPYLQSLIRSVTEGE
ncbi:MAG: hypothetical protein MJA27_29950 [Pseudanabaenales cyanobacterium]|nr:hypothetical protein [Pseudanabaenales cyanobacterium]